MKNQLGGEVGTNFEAKLACWRAKKKALEATKEAPKGLKKGDRSFQPANESPARPDGETSPY